EHEVPAGRIVLRPESAPVRLCEAARDREAEPGAAAGAAPERPEHRRAVRGGDPGAAIEDVDSQLGRAVLGPYDDRGPGRREPQRVLDQVREHALDLGGVDANRRRPRIELDDDPVTLGSDGLERLPDEIVRRPELRMALDRA